MNDQEKKDIIRELKQMIEFYKIKPSDLGFKARKKPKRKSANFKKSI